MPAVSVRHTPSTAIGALRGKGNWDEGGSTADGITGTLEDPIVVNSAGNEQYCYTDTAGKSQTIAILANS